MSPGADTAASVDPGEVARYDALAHTWWDATGPFWPLHRLNALRVDYLAAKLPCLHDLTTRSERPLAGLEVLDVGCGGGLLSEAMARLGARVLGIDVVERNVAVARRHAATGGLDVHYAVTTAEALSATQARFDVVLSMEVVEHVADLPGFVRACTRLVRPGGTLAVATLNRTLRAWLFAIVGAEYVLGWLPKGTHQWRRFVRPAALESLLGADGLRVVERTGVAVNPLTRRLRLTDSLAVNYMLLARR